MKITVLRLGHRYMRDKRISTHIGLVARALGADELLMDIKDPLVEESIAAVVSEWGGSFSVGVVPNWSKYIRDYEGDSIHLTMYGIGVSDCVKKIATSGRDKLIIVGGKKVPSEVYHMVDYNVAVGNQPHSEVAALAIFLDRLQGGEWEKKDFSGKKRIVPQEHGKLVEEKS
jgi:tRNA (cytidine56-2'-O)-methyltransferase